MYTWTVKTGERYWSVWLDWEKFKIFTDINFTSFMFSTSLEWRGLGRAPCLNFISIPSGKATFKELVRRGNSASWYFAIVSWSFAQSNTLSALCWWHKVAGSMSLKTSYEAQKEIRRLKRHLLNLPRKTQTFYYSSWKDQPVMDIPFTSMKVRCQ